MRYLGSYSDDQPAIPAAAGNKDTYHDNDTILGTTVQTYFGVIGDQVKGLANSLLTGSPAMWLGIGVVLFIVLNKKGRR